MAPASSTNPAIATRSHRRPCPPSLPGCMGSRWTMIIASAPNNFRMWLARQLEQNNDSGYKHHRVSRHSLQTLLVGTSIGQIGFALTISCSLVLSLTLVWHLLPACDSCDYDNTLGASAWLAWGVFFDPGTQTNLLPDDSSIWHKAAAAVFSVFGYIFNVALLGVIVEWIRASVVRFKKHHNTIIANGHVVVLGWTDKTLFLLEELAQMLHDSRQDEAGLLERLVRGHGGSGQIVVLGEAAQEDMLTEIRMAFPTWDERWPRVSVECLQGRPYEVDDLAR